MRNTSIKKERGLALSVSFLSRSCQKYPCTKDRSAESDVFHDKGLICSIGKGVALIMLVKYHCKRKKSNNFSYNRFNSESVFKNMCIYIHILCVTVHLYKITCHFVCVCVVYINEVL